MKGVLLVITAFVISSFVQTPSKVFLAGEKLMKELKAKSPTFAGGTMRQYAYEDLNFDGEYELIEKQNQIEEQAPGFLTAELYPAFELHRIFTYNGENFHRNYTLFDNYLEHRIIFYTLWKNQIQNPINLSKDSQQLIKANKGMFLKEVDRLLALTKNLQKK